MTLRHGLSIAWHGSEECVHSPVQRHAQRSSGSVFPFPAPLLETILGKCVELGGPCHRHVRKQVIGSLGCVALLMTFEVNRSRLEVLRRMASVMPHTLSIVKPLFFHHNSSKEEEEEEVELYGLMDVACSPFARSSSVHM